MLASPAPMLMRQVRYWKASVGELGGASAGDSYIFASRGATFRCFLAVVTNG
jgi:hypothetical protein